jgi:hypothetical protein
MGGMRHVAVVELLTFLNCLQDELHAILLLVSAIVHL